MPIGEEESIPLLFGESGRHPHYRKAEKSASAGRYSRTRSRNRRRRNYLPFRARSGLIALQVVAVHLCNLEQVYRPRISLIFRSADLYLLIIQLIPQHAVPQSGDPDR